MLRWNKNIRPQTECESLKRTKKEVELKAPFHIQKL